MLRSIRASSFALLALVGPLALGCGGNPGAGSVRSTTADGWFKRAKANYAAANIDEARDSVKKALAESPNDFETRVLGAKIALARLEYAETIQLLKGVKCDDDAKDEACKSLTTEVSSLRGRALWYKGDLDQAADELEALLNDPDVKDDWAKSVSKLARQGQGRTPFALSGRMIAVTDVVHVNPDTPYFVIQVEVDEKPGLALIHTATDEMVLDSSTRSDPAWVSLRFGDRMDTDRFEVHDVPAVPQDLTGISREVGAPIKVLIGVNLLRRLNATVDYDGRQFVARNFAPPPPPDATRMPLYYFKGGGMIVRSGFGDKGPTAALLVNTGVPYPVALDQAGWKKAGSDVSMLKPLEQAPGVMQGIVSSLRVGAFDVPQVPGLYSPQMNRDIEGLEKALQPVDLDGVIGAGLLSHFRCTFGDGGRLLWIEDNAALQKVLNHGAAPSPAPGGAARPVAPSPAGGGAARPVDQRQPPPR